MKIFAIIIETNPLHNGHKYLIDKIKSQYQPDILIALTSTYFTMRAEIGVYSKITKVNDLLNIGFDLVLEFPFSLYLQRADIFALNGIKILNNLNITNIAFGSETDDLDLYNKVFTLTSSQEFKEIFDNLNKLNSDSYKNNYHQALKLLKENNLTTNELDLISKPNFTLGYNYYKAIKDNNYPIAINIIKRHLVNYDDLNIVNNIASATLIRTFIKNKTNVGDYIVNKDANFIDIKSAHYNLSKLTNYLLMSNTRLNYDKEGIGNYILNANLFNLDYDDMILQLASKKYSKTRIRRYIINLIHNNNLNPYYDDNNPYVRILGFNQKGINYINSLEKNIKNIIFSNVKNNLTNEILQMELNSAKIYDILTNSNAYLDEFKFPIKK